MAQEMAPAGPLEPVEHEQHEQSDSQPDSRPMVYVEGDRRIYRASSVGGCIRSLVAAALGMASSDPHEFLLRAADFGSEQEPIIVRYLEGIGYRILDRQPEVELRVGRRYAIRGHLDALAEFLGQKVIVEIKTASVERAQRIVQALRTDRLAEVERKYAYQVSAYMLRLNLPAVYVVWPRERIKGQYQLVDAPFIERLDKPPVGLGILLRHLEEAERWIERGELPPCDQVQNSYFCPFRYLCEVPEVPQATHDRAAEIDHWAAVYRKAQAERDKAEAAMLEARTKLLQLAGTDEKVETDLYRVSISRFERPQYDLRAMEKDETVRPILERFRRTSKIEQVRVTEKRRGRDQDKHDQDKQGDES